MENNAASTLNVSGSQLKAILVAFGDYFQARGDFKKQIDYYIFDCHLTEGNIFIVKMGFDRKKLEEKLSIKSYRGGGAEYNIDSNSFEIIKKIWYR